MSDVTILDGAQPWSHAANGRRGALVIHGFTGNPSSMRGLADACAGAGYDVELPRLPGHGTTLDDMMSTGWDDWSAEADAAFERLAARTGSIVVIGLSMGGALALWLAGRHPEIRGLICVNPATQPQTADMTDMLDGLVAAGTTIIPGIGSDIADPDTHESAYDGTPVACLLDFLRQGLAVIAPTYATLQMPLLLMNSPQDHVVEPAQAEFLATHYGGPVERVTLERSFHVATLDHDKDLIIERALAFAGRLTP